MSVHGFTSDSRWQGITEDVSCIQWFTAAYRCCFVWSYWINKHLHMWTVVKWFVTSCFLKCQLPDQTLLHTVSNDLQRHSSNKLKANCRKDEPVLLLIVPTSDINYMEVCIAASQWFVPLGRPGLKKVVQWTLQHDHFDENLSLYDCSVDWWLQKSLWKLTVTCLETLTPGWRFVTCRAWDSVADLFVEPWGKCGTFNGVA